MIIYENGIFIVAGTMKSRIVKFMISYVKEQRVHWYIFVEKGRHLWCLCGFAFVRFVLVYAETHFYSCMEIFVLLFPCKNSLVRKSGSELFSPLINLISKSNADKIACHLANICFETRFSTSFCRISLADLQSIRKRNFLINKSS